ncbi:MAG: Molybdopterin molybdenumtransferase [Alphaproteobacteria bacterium MarineAlpha2_Bin1]|nr:MAG: Molybdopterin molybdenumtransferase [Alphaproteobacteria bacterium MarineAlpha2_Bin1]
MGFSKILTNLNINQTIEFIEKLSIDRPTTEEVLIENALGRIIVNDIYSNIFIPQFNCSAVDGYAIKLDDLAKSNFELKLIGKNPIGKIFKKNIEPLSTLKVFTGSHIPDFFDTVVMHEICKENDKTISFPINIIPGQNIRRRGEDISKSDRILEEGHILRSQDIGQLAAIGLKRIKIFKPLKIVIFSTGNELLNPGMKISQGKRYDSNKFILSSFLKQLNCDIVDLGIFKDNLELIKQAIVKNSIDSDIIITSGSASKGEEDYINKIIHQIGSIYISKIRVKPGKPLIVGKVNKSLIFALPGNTSAMFTILIRIIKPLVLLLSGASNYLPKCYYVESGFSYKKKSNRVEFLRVKLSNQNKKTIAIKHSKQTSGIFQSFIESDGLVELEENINYVNKGMLIKFIPFNEG